MAYSIVSTMSNMKSALSNNVTSDNYQVVTVIRKSLFILSQQMFQVSPISSHTGTLPSMPLVNCLVDDTLLQIRPCSSQAPLQISNVKYGPVVDTFLHDAPCFIVNWIYIGTIWLSQVWGNEV